MQLVKRENLKSNNNLTKYEVDFFSINSKNTFTIACKDGTLININKEELEEMKRFFRKILD